MQLLNTDFMAVGARGEQLGSDSGAVDTLPLNEITNPEGENTKLLGAHAEIAPPIGRAVASFEDVLMFEGRNAETPSKEIPQTRLVETDIQTEVSLRDFQGEIALCENTFCASHQSLETAEKPRDTDSLPLAETTGPLKNMYKEEHFASPEHEVHFIELEEDLAEVVPTETAAVTNFTPQHSPVASSNILPLDVPLLAAIEDEPANQATAIDDATSFPIQKAPADIVSIHRQHATPDTPPSDNAIPTLLTQSEAELMEPLEVSAASEPVKTPSEQGDDATQRAEKTFTKERIANIQHSLPPLNTETFATTKQDVQIAPVSAAEAVMQLQASTSVPMPDEIKPTVSPQSESPVSAQHIPHSLATETRELDAALIDVDVPRIKKAVDGLPLNSAPMEEQIDREKPNLSPQVFKTPETLRDTPSNIALTTESLAPTTDSNQDPRGKSDTTAAVSVPPLHTMVAETAINTKSRTIEGVRIKSEVVQSEFQAKPSRGFSEMPSNMNTEVSEHPSFNEGSEITEVFEMHSLEITKERDVPASSKTPDVTRMNTVEVDAAEQFVGKNNEPKIELGQEAIPDQILSAKGNGGPRDATTQSNMINRTELPTRIAMQIADVARQLPDRPVEITLTPEELGKVRLSFHLSENGAMNVVMSAERTDTLELLRRNIDSLASEFQDLGYSESGFSFESFNQDSQNHEQREKPSEFQGPRWETVTDNTDERRAITTEPVRLSLGSGAGVDIRL
ncbi:flagellar hook-length control protein FliK [Celeribacter halophilus]|uniref:flagellar hook-length control protein FliK n=1 Tax=Celeribacter halophilus TaxID=576117 RepID=UPI003A941647